MPKIISVNNHRFPGTNIYHTGPTAYEPGGSMLAGWVSPSPGILISPYPENKLANQSANMYRYNLVTNVTTTITIAANAARPNYNYSDLERPAFASLGGGYAQVLRIKDNNDGTATVTNWIWTDSTLSWSTGASLTISSGYSRNKSHGLYALAVGKTLFEHNTAAWVYNRTANTWTAVATAMPREVWAAAKISENLVYLAGKRDEVAGSGGGSPYTAKSAQSFLFDGNANTWTNLGHSMELATPPTRSFGGTETVETRSGQMQQWGTDGVLAVGANSNWMVYRHTAGLLFSRARTVTPYNFMLLRSDPLSWAINTATTDYVYSW